MKTVTIPIKEYEALLANSRVLTALENGAAEAYEGFSVAEVAFKVRVKQDDERELC